MFRLFTKNMADIAAGASMTQAPTSLSDEQELNEFREIVWGPNIRIDVFQRWSQGLFAICHNYQIFAVFQTTIPNVLFVEQWKNTIRSELFTQKILILIEQQSDICDHEFFFFFYRFDARAGVQHVEIVQWKIGIWCKCWINWILLLRFSPIGFEFSESEPSALVQRQGGPCAVIAPVQAYLLKTVLSETNSPNLRDVSVPNALYLFSINISMQYALEECRLQMRLREMKCVIFSLQMHNLTEAHFCFAIGISEKVFFLASKSLTYRNRSIFSLYHCKSYF